eukprot:COSAG06_NODE_533_length_14542_cov_17.021325_4_plen_139_part_00
MPKGKKGKQQEEEEIVAEEKLQAVVIAQAFELEKSWAPLSCDVPPALFPLANVPLIDYTMQLLVGNGVKEIFVFCGGGEHGAKIKHYLKISQWCARQPRLTPLSLSLSLSLSRARALLFGGASNRDLTAALADAGPSC